MEWTVQKQVWLKIHHSSGADGNPTTGADTQLCQCPLSDLSAATGTPLSVSPLETVYSFGRAALSKVVWKLTFASYRSENPE